MSAEEVLTEWYGLLRSAAATLRLLSDESVPTSSPAVRNIADDIEAALAPYPTSRALTPLEPQVVVAQDVKRRYPHNPDVVCGREGRAVLDALTAAGYSVVPTALASLVPAVPSEGLTEEERKACDEAQAAVEVTSGRLAAGELVLATEERDARLFAKLLTALDRLAASVPAVGPGGTPHAFKEGVDALFAAGPEELQEMIARGRAVPAVGPGEVRPGRFTAKDGNEVDVIEVGSGYQLFVTQNHGSSVGPQAGVHVSGDLVAWLHEHLPLPPPEDPKEPPTMARKAVALRAALLERDDPNWPAPPEDSPDE